MLSNESAELGEEVLEQDDKEQLLTELFDIKFRLSKLGMDKEATAASDLHYKICKFVYLKLKRILKFDLSKFSKGIDF